MSGIVIDFNSRRAANMQTAASAVAAREEAAAKELMARLEEINGTFRSAEIAAALPAADGGYVLLHFPAGSAIEMLPFMPPVRSQHLDRDSFREAYSRLKGDVSIRLTSHFYNAGMEPKDPDAPAPLYALSVNAFYKVVKDGIYRPPSGDFEKNVSTAEGIVEFNNRRVIIDTLEKARSHVVSVKPRLARPALI